MQKLKHSLIILGLLTTFYTICSCKDMDTTEQYIHAGDTAPDFTVEMLDGSKITLTELKGKVVMLNFFTTSCPHCIAEFEVVPAMIINNFKDEQDFIFLPISREEKKETVAEKMKFLKTQGIDFPVGIDPTRKIYSLYAKKYVPRIFIINKEGIVTYTSSGFSIPEFNQAVSAIEKELE